MSAARVRLAESLALVAGSALLRTKRAGRPFAPGFHKSEPEKSVLVSVDQVVDQTGNLAMALNVRFALDSDRIADIAEGPSCAISGHRLERKSLRTNLVDDIGTVRLRARHILLHLL